MKSKMESCNSQFANWVLIGGRVIKGSNIFMTLFHTANRGGCWRDLFKYNYIYENHLLQCLTKVDCQQKV